MVVNGERHRPPQPIARMLGFGVRRIRLEETQQCVGAHLLGVVGAHGGLGIRLK